MFLIITVIAVSLAGSFLCSLMEASLYSMSRARIETMKRRGDKSGEMLLKLRERIDEPIAAILILNTIANTAGAAIAGALIATHYGDTALGIFSGVFTGCVLIFSEIIPKSLGFKFANKLAPLLVWPLKLLILLLWPIVRFCVFITGLFGKNVHIALPTEDDIISLASLGAKEGSILLQEAKWITNALHLDKKLVQDIMTPLSVVRRIAENVKLSEVQTSSDLWLFSRLPAVSANDPGSVTGIIQRRNIFRNLAEDKTGLSIKELMTEPVFVSPKMKVNEALSLFIKSRQHLFCVRDDNKQWIGIVTLEDAIETLLGAEIIGEYDLHEDMQLAAKEIKTAVEHAKNRLDSAAAK